MRCLCWSEASLKSFGDTRSGGQAMTSGTAGWFKSSIPLRSEMRLPVVDLRGFRKERLEEEALAPSHRGGPPSV